MKEEKAKQEKNSALDDQVNAQKCNPEATIESMAGHLSRRYSGAPGGRQTHRWQTIIDRAFASLERRGIVARHDFSDCMSGGLADIWDEMREFAVARSLVPIGYTFYHAQDTWEASENGELLLAFGSICTTDEAAAEVGRIVCDVLAKHGLDVDWDGAPHTRIQVTFDQKAISCCCEFDSGEEDNDSPHEGRHLVRRFALDPSVALDGSHMVGEFIAAPADLVRVLGYPPSPGDGYKTSGEYAFLADDGTVFALYDWRETTLYWGEEEGVPHPASFWQSDEPVVFYIGGVTHPGEFIRWLSAILAGEMKVPRTERRSEKLTSD